MGAWHGIPAGEGVWLELADELPTSLSLWTSPSHTYRLPSFSSSDLGKVPDGRLDGHGTAWADTIVRPFRRPEYLVDVGPSGTYRT